MYLKSLTLFLMPYFYLRYKNLINFSTDIANIYTFEVFCNYSYALIFCWNLKEEYLFSLTFQLKRTWCTTISNGRCFSIVRPRLLFLRGYKGTVQPQFRFSRKRLFLSTYLELASDLTSRGLAIFSPYYTLLRLQIRTC
jgi:hypothetical protein